MGKLLCHKPQFETEFLNKVFSSGRRIRIIQHPFKLAKCWACLFSCFKKRTTEINKSKGPGQSFPFQLVFWCDSFTFSREAGVWESWYSYLENCLVGCVYLKVKSGPSQMVKLKLHFGTWKMPFYFVLPLPSQKSSVALFFT